MNRLNERLLVFDSVIKWSATLILIVGSFVNSMQIYPQGPWLLVLGGVLWLISAVRMQDRALIVTNAVMVLAGAGPLIYRML
jgi:hypothetical protein